MGYPYYWKIVNIGGNCLHLITEEESTLLYGVQEELLLAIRKDQNKNALISLAILQTLPPIADYMAAVEIIEHANQNVVSTDAKIIGAYLSAVWGHTTQNTLLLSLLESFSQYKTETQSLICYCHALQKFYGGQDATQELYNSIRCYSGHVNNWLMLSKLVGGKDAEKCISNAKNNIKRIIQSDTLSLKEVIDPIFYIEKNITGAYVDDRNYRNMFSIT